MNHYLMITNIRSTVSVKKDLPCRLYLMKLIYPIIMFYQWSLTSKPRPAKSERSSKPTSSTTALVIAPGVMSNSVTTPSLVNRLESGHGGGGGRTS